MSKCCDPDIGRLLHLYELHALTDHETEQFETHLMQCEFCFNEVNSFAEKTEMLRRSEQIHRLSRESERKYATILGLERIWKYLWPRTPIVFRPAIIYLLIIIMAFPAYIGFKTIIGFDTEIRTVQAINLTTARANHNSTFKMGDGRDGIIEFTLPDASPGENYRLVITSETNETILRIDDYTGFNEYGVGELFFPLSKMAPGNYKLLIYDIQANGTASKYEYRFKIVQ